MADHKTLSAALLASQQQIQAVAKDSLNPQYKSKYATSDEITVEARRTLNANGLTVQRTSWKLHDLLPDVPGVTATYRLEHATDAREFEVSLPVVVTNGRPIDKACLSALTSLNGYFLLGLLQIERSDEEVGGRVDDERAPPQKAAPKMSAELARLAIEAVAKCAGPEDLEKLAPQLAKDFSDNEDVGRAFAMKKSVFVEEATKILQAARDPDAALAGIHPWIRSVKRVQEVHAGLKKGLQAAAEAS